MHTSPRHIIPSDTTSDERSATIIPFSKPLHDEATAYRPTRRSNEMIDFFRMQLACSDTTADK